MTINIIPSMPIIHSPISGKDGSNMTIFRKIMVLGCLFTLSACGGGGSSSTTPNNSAPTASGVSITDDNGGNAVAGDGLTGNYTYADADSDAEGMTTFRWLRDAVAISGATSSTYSLVAADNGTNITFEVTPVAMTGTTMGNAVTSSALVITTPPAGNTNCIVGTSTIDNCTL